MSSINPSADLTPADLLRQKHEAAADAVTPASVEEVLVNTSTDDEVSTDLTSSITTVTSAPETAPSSTSASSATSPASAPSSKRNGKAKIDLFSLEAFPALGGLVGNKNTAGSSVWGKAPGAVTATTTKAVNPNSAVRPVRSSEITDIFSIEINSQQRGKGAFSDVVVKAKAIAGISSIESSTSSLSGATTFIVKGKPDSVREARRELVRGLTARVTLKLLVPSSALSFIIGHRGKNLSAITSKTQTRIQVSKRPNDAEDNTQDDDEDTADVVIEGDVEGVQQAKQEVLAIVDERTKTLTTKLSQINIDYFPYIFTQIASLEEGKELTVKVPKIGSSEPTVIVLSGDRTAVQEAKAKIEEITARLRETYSIANANIPKRQHRFVAGDKEKGIQEIFDSTGVLVKVPSAEDSTENITFVGPRDKISEALTLAFAKANSVIIDSLDISKAHGKSRSHARDLARYFTNRKKLVSIEQDNDVQISIPISNDLFDENIKEVNFDVAGKDVASVKKARKDIVDLINGISPVRVAHITGIDVLFYKHLAGVKNKNVQKVREQFAVETIIPTDADVATDILLVYEGQDEEFAPDVSEIKAALDNVIYFYQDIASKQEKLVTKVISISLAQHKYIIGPKRSTINAITGGPDSAVYVQFGAVNDRYIDVDGLNEDSIAIRGPAEDVEKVINSINDVLEEAKNQEVLNSFTVDFAFPTKFSSFLIGKGGANIGKYREDLGVKIDLDENGTVTIKGIKKNVLEAESRIKSLAKRLEDEVLLRINVPNEYHAALIGQKGKFVKRLEERYEVRVNFPRSEDSEGESKENLPKSKDEIVIRGPSKGAAKAKEELLELYKYEVAHGHTATLKVSKKALPRIIGRNGELINEIIDTTGAKITFDREVDDENERTFELSGTEESIQQAKEKIQEIVDEFEQFASKTIEVDKKYHKALIGSRGSVLRDILAKAGAPETTNQQRRIIRIPPAETSSNQIVVAGNKDVVERVIKEIEARVSELEKQVEHSVEIPLEKHRFIIGPGGSVKKSIEQEFSVTLTVPPQNTSKEIKIQGTDEDIEKAKARIIELTTKKSNGRKKSRETTPATAETTSTESAEKE
ncbi:hypothetical protein V1514DRAFT_277444 [Lipomyces japonicus]|uniref:uncharacterized protein n=1 Tax=Lipomyces japonicus TaxID=56871 RepID=UPI0034CEAB3B